MPDLGHREKEQIVVLLARFRSPSEIAAQLRLEIGIELTIQQITKYDPSRAAFDAGEKWRAIFDAAREDYLTGIANVPISNQGYRLQLLQEGVEAARRAKNWKLMAELVEQAAREVGGSLTNQRRFELAEERSVRDLSAQERAALLGSIISKAIEQRKAMNGDALVVNVGAALHPRRTMNSFEASQNAAPRSPSDEVNHASA